MILSGPWAQVCYNERPQVQRATKEEMQQVLQEPLPSVEAIKSFKNSLFYECHKEEVAKYVPELSKGEPPLFLISSQKQFHSRNNVYVQRVPANLPVGSLLKMELPDFGSLYFPMPELQFHLRAEFLDIMQLSFLASYLCAKYHIEPIEKRIEREIKPLSSKEKLEKYARMIGGRKLSKEIKAIKLAVERAESPAEIGLAAFTSFPVRLGGCGLTLPVCGTELLLSQAAKQYMGNRTNFRPDLFWPTEKVIVEYDSDTFHSEKKRIEHDKRRVLALEAMGYSVKSVTREAFSNPSSRAQLMVDISRMLGKNFEFSERWLFAERELAKEVFSWRLVY